MFSYGPLAGPQPPEGLAGAGRVGGFSAHASRFGFSVTRQDGPGPGGRGPPAASPPGRRRRCGGRGSGSAYGVQEGVVPACCGQARRNAVPPLCTSMSQHSNTRPPPARRQPARAGARACQCVRKSVPGPVPEPGASKSCQWPDLRSPSESPPSESRSLCAA